MEVRAIRTKWEESNEERKEKPLKALSSRDTPEGRSGAVQFAKEKGGQIGT